MAGKRRWRENIVERVGYTVYVASEKVRAYLLRATSVRDYKALSSTDKNKPTTSTRTSRRGDDNVVEFSKDIMRRKRVYGNHHIVTTRAATIIVSSLVKTCGKSSTFDR